MCVFCALRGWWSFGKIICILLAMSWIMKALPYTNSILGTRVTLSKFSRTYSSVSAVSCNHHKLFGWCRDGTGSNPITPPWEYGSSHDLFESDML